MRGKRGVLGKVPTYLARNETVGALCVILVNEFGNKVESDAVLDLRCTATGKPCAC